jgi:hypothetical protein
MLAEALPTSIRVLPPTPWPPTPPSEAPPLPSALSVDVDAGLAPQAVQQTAQIQPQMRRRLAGDAHADRAFETRQDRQITARFHLEYQIQKIARDIGIGLHRA